MGLIVSSNDDYTDTPESFWARWATEQGRGGPMKEAPNHVCPRCGGPVPRAGHEGEYPGALSRVDNETEICSACGLDEGLTQYMSGGKPLSRDDWFDVTGVRKLDVRTARTFGGLFHRS